VTTAKEKKMLDVHKNSVYRYDITLYRVAQKSLDVVFVLLHIERQVTGATLHVCSIKSVYSEDRYMPCIERTSGAVFQLAIWKNSSVGQTMRNFSADTGNRKNLDLSTVLVGTNSPEPINDFISIYV
jgi:hypothetical protein